MNWKFIMITNNDGKNDYLRIDSVNTFPDEYSNCK